MCPTQCLRFHHFQPPNEQNPIHRLTSVDFGNTYCHFYSLRYPFFLRPACISIFFLDRQRKKKQTKKKNPPKDPHLYPAIYPMTEEKPSQQGQQPSDPLGTSVEDLYLESYAFTTAAAIVGSVDRKIFVLLKDGRNFFGILRTFDQFANLVLQDTFERIYVEGEPKKFGEIYRGVFIVRGENVVMMGELDIDREDDHLENLQQIPFEQAEQEQKQQHAQLIKEENTKKKTFFEKGLIYDFQQSVLY